MWPFSEMSLPTAVLVGSIANWGLLASLVIGVVSTFFVVKTTDIKEHHWDAARTESQLQIARLDNETTKLRKQAAPRNLTKEQQELIASKLSGFSKPNATIRLSPWSTEGDNFLDGLWSAVGGAGWRVKRLVTTPLPTITAPIGVIVQFRPSGEEEAANALADALNELGIEAHALAAPPDSFSAPDVSVAITVSVKL